MSGPLPFTLTPLEGEPFGVWLHAFAARLALPPRHLAAALGLPPRHHDPEQLTQPPPIEAATSIRAATGLPTAAVTGLFTAGRSPSPRSLAAWMPHRVTRFCPACLAATPGQVTAAWCLPVTFFCLRHGQALATSCPHCGHQPASLPPRGHQLWVGCASCGGRLEVASPPPCPDVPAAMAAQQAVNEMLATVRDPAAAPARRRQALDGLTDLAVTAFHLATGEPAARHRFTPAMLDSATLTTAFTLLTARPGTHGHGRLARLAAQHRSVAQAVPRTWREASPPLRARVTHARDRWLRPADRLRHATTLATPRVPASRPPGAPDIALTRATRLPAQLWADWALRLTDSPGARHDTFRPAAVTALLLPHSHLPLQQVTDLASGQLKRHTTSYQMGKLTTAGLRILTELAFALDEHDIPIDYQRRRDLTAHTTLLTEHTWQVITRDAGMTATHPRHARRYLHELLTGGHPHPTTGNLPGYHEFTTGITTNLAAALRDHARHLLRAHGTSGEPLEWQPPTSWVSVTTWPGTDPTLTDPAPIHHALLHDGTPPATIAARLGITPDHLRRVLHHHPLPRPRRPLRRTLIPRPAPASPPPGQQPGVLYLDPAWLRGEYLTRHRPLHDIAAQLGCPTHLLNRFAHTHGIPVRPRGTPVPAAFTHGDLPEPLRHALTGRTARRRLHRLHMVSEHASINQAAQALGLWPSILYTQLARLEHACGGPLIRRKPRPPGTGTLTPLGQQLLRQAHDHLGW